MYKRKLRLQILERLNQLSEEEKTEIENLLISHLIHSKLFQKSSVIGTTFSQLFEWNTKPIMEKAWEENKTVVVPKTYPMKRQLTFFEVHKDSELEVGYGNILEPKEEYSKKYDKNEIDLLIVPGIVFDEYGYRIGFGGGYYDRFLTDYKRTTVSIASKRQMIEKIPIQPYDIPVDFLVTEDGFYRVKIYPNR